MTGVLLSKDTAGICGDIAGKGSVNLRFMTQADKNVSLGHTFPL